MFCFGTVDGAYGGRQACWSPSYRVSYHNSIYLVSYQFLSPLVEFVSLFIIISLSLSLSFCSPGVGRHVLATTGQEKATAIGVEQGR